jgi:outer membrane protease
MGKERHRLQAAIFCSTLIFLPPIAHAQADSSLRDKAMEETLYAIETKARSSSQVLFSSSENFLMQNPGQIEDIERGTYQIGLFPHIERERVIEKTLNKIEFELAIGMGYLNGVTSYEIDFPVDGYTGRSKLEFPFGNWLTGGNILVGYYPFYLNFQGWTNISKKRTGDMKDKDWLDSYLVSSTESDADAQMVILDARLLYNFWQGDNPWGDLSNIFQKGRAGFLIGYKYENFKHDIIGVKDSFTGESSYLGQKVLDYEVKYHMPYLGLNWCYFKDVVDKDIQSLDTWGVNVQVCGSPYVRAEDRDDHILRNKVSKGKAKGYGLLMGLNTFLKAKNNWIGRLGLDYTGILADGKQNQYWYGNDPAGPGDETGSSIEDINLQIESSQCLFWCLFQYNF